MKFILRKRSQQEIQKIQDEHRVYSRMVKGNNFIDVCPYELVLANGKSVEVWSLTEQDILNVIEANLMEGIKDHQRAVWTHQIISTWKEKHGKISVDMIEGFFKLEEKYKDQKSHLADFQGDMGAEDIAFAKRVANYLNGMTGDKKDITYQNIVKILRNEQKLKEKQLNNNQTA